MNRTVMLLLGILTTTRLLYSAPLYTENFGTPGGGSRPLSFTSAGPSWDWGARGDDGAAPSIGKLFMLVRPGVGLV